MKLHALTILFIMLLSFGGLMGCSNQPQNESDLDEVAHQDGDLELDGHERKLRFIGSSDEQLIYMKTCDQRQDGDGVLLEDYCTGYVIETDKLHTKLLDEQRFTRSEVNEFIDHVKRSRVIVHTKTATEDGYSNPQLLTAAVKLVRAHGEKSMPDVFFTVSKELRLARPTDSQSNLLDQKDVVDRPLGHFVGSMHAESRRKKAMQRKPRR